MNNTAFSDYTQGSDDLGGGTTLGGFGYGVGLSLAVLVVFVVITYFSYKCKTQSQRQSHPSSAALRRPFPDEYSGSVHVVIHRDGLDAAVISTFPLYTYAQLKPHKGAAAGCAVCLGDYKDSEAVRLLPECGHVFHRSCIDPWLMIHPTCPICRNSPLKAAEAAAATPQAFAQPAPVADQ